VWMRRAYLYIMEELAPWAAWLWKRMQDSLFDP
jgi:hypothetical protein